MSSNAQSSVYWDYELNRGLRLAAIGGSQTGSPKVAMGTPLTYVYAKEKSLKGILDGIRLGRTYISNGLDGPKIDWVADIFDDGTIDTGIGGIVPIDEDTSYFCRIQNAKGKKLEILLNGSPIASKNIDSDDFGFTYIERPTAAVVYRLRVFGQPTDRSKGFGLTETFAMTSPIYARGVIAIEDKLGALVKIDNEYISPETIKAFNDHLKRTSPPIN